MRKLAKAKLSSPRTRGRRPRGASWQEQGGGAAQANRPARLEVTFVELKDYNESTSLGKKNLPSL